jgi:2-keto-myo-inositol isomerase
MNQQSTRKQSRREVMVGATAALAAAATAGPLTRRARAQRASDSTSEPFKYCLNSSTIRGQNIGIAAEVELAAKVGFHGLEPWVSELEDYQKKHGSLKDLRKQIDDSGLKIVDAIAFPQWIADDDAQRAKALEQAKREMDLVSQVGGTHIAAPASGEHAGTALSAVAERYRAMLELGDKMGVTPILELWGHSKLLSKVSDVAYVACEARHPKSAILLDIYHMYKGGSNFEELHLLAGQALPVIHTNDYPDKPDRSKINDSFRVYPGDGVAPLGQIFKTLKSIGFDGYLSVELFNRTYWKESPAKVAQAAIDKTRAAVKAAMG